MNKRVLTITLCMLCIFKVSSQVSIGHDDEPEKGALLQLKTTEEVSPGGATTDKEGGGLLLPRVNLEKRDELYFIPKSDIEYETKRLKHKGLVVYNIRQTTDGLNPGMHVWDGAAWQPMDENNSALKGTWLKEGNSGTNEATDFLGTTDENPLSIKTNGQTRIHISGDGKIGIGTTQPTADLQIEGTVRLTNTPEIRESNPQILAIDHEGNVGISASIPAKLLFAESPVTQQLSTAKQKEDFNNAIPVVVSWENQYIITNNLMDFDPVNNAFTFRENALCEVSGFIIYTPYAQAPTTYLRLFADSGVGLNVIIQYQAKGTNTWVDFTAARVLWVGGSVTEAGKTVTVPPAVRTFSAGDKIRMIFLRPSNSFALKHHQAGNGGIMMQNYKGNVKGLKIIAM